MKESHKYNSIQGITPFGDTLKRKLLLVIYIFFLLFNIFSKTELNNSLNIGFTIKSNTESFNFTRGSIINWSRNISKSLYWGINFRFISNDFSSNWYHLGYLNPINDSISIPIEFGLGIKTLDFNFSKDSDASLSLFLHGQTGFEITFDTNWSYIFNMAYNYNFQLDNKHNLFFTIGIKYLF